MMRHTSRASQKILGWLIVGIAVACVVAVIVGAVT